MPLELRADKRNGIYYVRGTVTVWRGGQPHSVEVFRSTRTRDRDQADAIRRQIENEAAERNITGKEPAVTFQQAAIRYERNGGEARFLSKPVAHLGPYRVDQITQQIIDDKSIAAYPVQADATRRRQFYAPVIAVLRTAGIGTAFRRAPDGKKRTIFMIPSAADALLANVVAARYPNPWTPALATFLFCHGPRVGEAVQIDGRDDLNLDHGFVMLRHTKSGKERMVHLCARSKAALSAIPNAGSRGPLFLRYDGRPYRKPKRSGYVMRWWDTAASAAGLGPEFTPHTARHSWATWHYSLYRDVVRLKAEGGWDSDEWERYVKLSSPSLGHAAAQHGFLDVENPWSDRRSPAAIVK